jgi:prepilin-type N-terminal cleavage/methylation domain-containing protein
MNARTHKRTLGREGFTLVEMLVVVAILAILVALGVAVGRHVRVRAKEGKTYADLQVIHSAIREYRDVTGDVPLQGDPNDSTTDPNDTLPVEDDHEENLEHAGITSFWLREQLSEVPATRDILARLSTGEGDAVIGPYDIPDVGTRTIFVDQFGGPIWYLHAGGKGEGPVVISAGVNGEFGDSDDIRSDD